MKQLKNIVASAFFCALCSSFLKAQEQTLPITLEAVLKTAGADNLKIKELQAKQELAVAKHIKSKEWILPEVYTGITIHQLNGTAMNADGRFFTEVNRQNFWGGLGINAQWDIGGNLYRSKAAKQQIESTKFQTQAEKNREMLRVVDAYFELQAGQATYNAYLQLLEQSESIVQQIEIQVVAGLQHQSDLLLAKSNLNHTKIALKETEIEMKQSSAALVELLNIQDNVELVAADSIFVPVELVKEQPNKETAFSLRPELKKLESDISSLQIEQKTFSTGLLFPTLKLGTYDSYFGELISPLYNTFELNTALLWSIPLGTLLMNGDKKIYNSKIKINQILVDETKAQITREIVSANAQANLAKEQIKLAEEALQFANEALSQSIERQKLRTSKPFEVFQAEEYYIRAQVDYINAIKSYNKAQYWLYIALGNNL